MMVLRIFPFQSTSQAASRRSLGSGTLYCLASAPDIFCSPIQSPSGAAAMALGKPGGALNRVLVVAERRGISARRPWAIAGAMGATAPASAKPAAPVNTPVKKSRLAMVISILPVQSLSGRANT